MRVRATDGRRGRHMARRRSPGVGRWTGTVLAAVLGVAALAGPLAGTSGAAPADRDAPLTGLVPGPLTVSGNHFVDADGRQVFLHGLFGVWKIPGGLPPDNDDPDGFTPADADTVSSLGFDTFRLAWFWADLEPTRGTYDTAYLSGYTALADELEQRGMFVLADAHQDQFSATFDGDGFPSWASPASDSDPDPVAFPAGYFTGPVQEAFDAFWADQSSVQEDYDAAWQQVASKFVGDPMLVGYDLMNEPFPGSDYGPCTQVRGCRRTDATVIEPAETRAAEAVRQVDPNHIDFYEPNIFFNWGEPTGLERPPTGVSPVGLSFHDQCLERSLWKIQSGSGSPTAAQEATCLSQEEVPLARAKRTARKLGGVPFMTEVATITDNDPAGLECVLENADAAQTSWTYGLSWKGGELRDLDPQKEAVLARAYPVAVAGTVKHYAFDARTGVFTMTYLSDGATAPTVISVPTAVHDPNGYRVTFAGKHPLARVTSAPGAPALTVTAPAGARVTMTVTPTGDVVNPAASLPSCSALLNPSS